MSSVFSVVKSFWIWMNMVRFVTAGESHGQGLVIIVEGVPAGLPLDEDYIGVHLARRQKGYGRGGRMLIEQDWAHIVSGVRHGETLGSPIGMTVENRDWANWEEAMAVRPIEGEPQSPRSQRITRLRPGHADLPGSHEVRLQRCAQRPRTRQRPRDRRPRGRRGRRHATAGGVRHRRS